jgi:hypothetical protein
LNFYSKIRIFKQRPIFRRQGVFRLLPSLFNLLDSGGELSENVFSGGERLANELQLPRSLGLGVVLEI